VVATTVVVVGRTAAIFDLDRTLLRGASGPLINQALKELGLRTTSIPGEGLLYKSYEVFGENPLGMALARAAALAVRGWPVDRLRAAGRRAAELLVSDIAAYVPALVEEHRRAGHLLVLATTTPDDLVRPLADLLGLDDVVATRYAWVDGVYTGKLQGGFVWGFGKLTALRKWADRHDVELSESFAYSDSINDLPMLSAVGHATAVNPDLALHALAMVRRWPVLHLDVPPGVPTLAGVEAFDVAKRVIRPELFPYARFDIAGTENIPDSGPFILVANHRSYFDVAALALVVRQKGRPTRFLGKKELFDAPVVGHLARALGGIPVARAGDASGSLGPAEQVLRAGEGLVVLPQGTIPRGRAFFDPDLRGKTGAARLAASTHAPAIPVGLWNTEAVWPRSSSMPNVVNVLSPPTVRVRVGPAVDGLRLGPADAVADTERLMAAIASLLPPEAREVREPTSEEMTRTYPKGKVGEERAVGLAPSEASLARRAGKPARRPGAGADKRSRRAVAAPVREKAARSAGAATSGGAKSAGEAPRPAVARRAAATKSAGATNRPPAARRAGAANRPPAARRAAAVRTAARVEQQPSRGAAAGRAH
jgi:putative phosphoserine phosphatase / 1-acylglycerol-3-phosphate O-acyltransferase